MKGLSLSINIIVELKNFIVQRCFFNTGSPNTV